MVGVGRCFCQKRRSEDDFPSKAHFELSTPRTLFASLHKSVVAIPSAMGCNRKQEQTLHTVGVRSRIVSVPCGSLPNIRSCHIAFAAEESQLEPLEMLLAFKSFVHASHWHCYSIASMSLRPPIRAYMFKPIDRVRWT